MDFILLKNWLELNSLKGSLWRGQCLHKVIDSEYFRTVLGDTVSFV